MRGSTATLRDYDQTTFFRQLEKFENNWAINCGNTLTLPISDPYPLCLELSSK